MVIPSGFCRKGYALMSAKDVEAIVFPDGKSGFVSNKEDEKSYEEEYPDEGFDEVYDNKKSEKNKKTRKEYKFKKDEITVFNWGKKFNIK